MYDLVVIGNPLYSAFSNLPQQHEGRVVSGPAITAAHVATTLGVQDLIFVGAIGNDYRSQFLNDLDELGIPEHYILDAEDTAGFQIDCQDSGLLSMSPIASGRPLRIRDFPDELLNSRYILLLPSYREIDVELVAWLSDSSNAMLIIDPFGFVVSSNNKGQVAPITTRDDILNLIEYGHIVKIDRSLWRIVTNDADPLVVAEFLVEHGAQIGIVMMSTLGAIVYDGQEFMVVPFERASSLNTLSASGAFLGAFIAGMLQDRTWLECSSLAASAASIVLEKDCATTNISSFDISSRSSSIMERISFR